MTADNDVCVVFYAACEINADGHVAMLWYSPPIICIRVCSFSISIFLIHLCWYETVAETVQRPTTMYRMRASLISSHTNRINIGFNRKSMSLLLFLFIFTFSFVGLTHFLRFPFHLLFRFFITFFRLTQAHRMSSTSLIPHMWCIIFTIQRHPIDLQRQPLHQ